MKKTPVLYPTLILLNYVLTLSAYNFHAFHPFDFVRPAIASILFSILVLALVYALLRDWNRAAIGAFILTINIARYANLARLVNQIGWLPENDTITLLIVVVFTLLLFFIATHKAVWERLKKPEFITKLFNVVALAMLTVPVYMLVNSTASTLKLGRNVWNIRDDYAERIISDVKPAAALPDIYYIIFDAYTRSDVLDELYDYDNSALTSYLKSRGFYIADESTSNYPQTALSMSSSLNMNYLDTFVGDIPEATDRYPLNGLIENSITWQVLESQGYTLTPVTSGYHIVHMDGAFSWSHPTGLSVNLFESFLLSQSMLNPIVEMLQIRSLWPSFDAHAAIINNAIKQIEAAPLNGDSPQFVLAHVLVPHAPFIFDAEGNIRPQNGKYSIHDGNRLHWDIPEKQQLYLSLYRDQITHVDQLIIEMIDDILANSETNPVIIIQGDHGSGLLFNFDSQDASCIHERFSILNAYYVPQDLDVPLYPQITPINSFRVLLDALFDTGLGTLDDRSYYANWEYPYQFSDVTAETNIPCVIPWE